MDEVGYIEAGQLSQQKLFFVFVLRVQYLHQGTSLLIFLSSFNRPPYLQKQSFINTK